MAERKSKPKKAEVSLEKNKHRRRDLFYLIAILFGSIAIVEGMIVISNFLAEGKTTTPLLIALGITAAFSALFVVLGIMAGRRSAA
jgi:hypothetical protein